MLVYLPIKRLKNYDRNPRKITQESMEVLCQNMTSDPEFMERRPLLCYKHENEKDYVVYAGNQRLRGAKKLGWSEIACIVDEYPDKDLIRKRIVLDNKSAGEWDYDILSADYDAEELFSLGFTEKDLFGKEEKEKTIPVKLKATITFSDEDEMSENCPKLEDFCETLGLKLTIGK